MILTPDAATQHGLSRSGLYRAAGDGRLRRIARGIYLAADAAAADWNWIEAATRRPDATICLVSALAHHDLTDEIPASLDIAIPRGTRTPGRRHPHRLALVRQSDLRPRSRPASRYPAPRPASGCTPPRGRSPTCSASAGSTGTNSPRTP